jgi:hypothetical protein
MVQRPRLHQTSKVPVMAAGATAVALGFLAGLGIKDIAILSIVGGGVFYATMRLIDRPHS